MKEIVSADMIREALARAYTTPEWYLGFEVGNSTGYNCRRHADAVAINAWPSKGFETRGFEIKVSKQDLKAELENGEKSDVIARYCDYWFLVVPKGLAESFTLPPTWGVIEYNGGNLRQKINATKLDKTPPSAGFLCAMLRGRERVMIEKAGKISEERKQQILEEAKWLAGNAEGDLKILHDKLREIKAATGIELNKWTPTDSIINRLNAAKSLEIITYNAGSIERWAKKLLEDAKEIAAASAAIKATEATEEVGA